MIRTNMQRALKRFLFEQYFRPEDELRPADTSAIAIEGFGAFRPAQVCARVPRNEWSSEKRGQGSARTTASSLTHWLAPTQLADPHHPVAQKLAMGDEEAVVDMLSSGPASYTLDASDGSIVSTFDTTDDGQLVGSAYRQPQLPALGTRGKGTEPARPTAIAEEPTAATAPQRALDADSSTTTPRQ